MTMFLILLFGLLSIVFCVMFLRQKKKMSQKNDDYEKLVEELKKAKEQGHFTVRKFDQFQDKVWQAINTIHLYAALSEEESDSLKIKENQQAIQMECEKIEIKL